MLAVALLILTIGFYPISFAEEEDGNYHSNATTSFYGKYVPKEDEKPIEKDKEDEDEVVKRPPRGPSSGSGSSGWSGSGGSSHSNYSPSERVPSRGSGSSSGSSYSGNSSDKIIPKAGNKDYGIITLIGLLSLVGSGLLIGRNKFKQSN